MNRKYLELFPMSETPTRWPVTIFAAHPLPERCAVLAGEHHFAWCQDNVPNRLIGWFYPDAAPVEMPDPKAVSISLNIATAEYPFNPEECRVVDYSCSERGYVIECDAVDAITRERDELKAEVERLRGRFDKLLAWVYLAPRLHAQVAAECRGANGPCYCGCHTSEANCAE